jgi:hypothetical protein
MGNPCIDPSHRIGDIGTVHGFYTDENPPSYSFHPSAESEPPRHPPTVPPSISAGILTVSAKERSRKGRESDPSAWIILKVDGGVNKGNRYSITFSCKLNLYLNGGEKSEDGVTFFLVKSG